MDKEKVAREAAEALYEGENHSRALWRIISHTDEDLYKLLRNYKFGRKASLSAEIEDRIESLEQLDG